MPKISKQYYKNFIAQNKTNLLIEEMLKHLSQYLANTQKPTIQKIYDALIILSGQWKGVKHQDNLDIIDDTTIRKSRNRINDALLHNINALPAYYFAYLNGDQKTTNTSPDLRQQVASFHEDNQFEYDAFLSFSTKDLVEAKQICEELRGYGLSVFLSDEALKANTGASFSEKIEYALNNSQHFILLSSVNSMDSEWVKIEYETFFNEYYIKNKKQRRFIILKSEQFSLQHVPKIYRRLQFAGTPKDILATFVKDQNFRDKQEKEQAERAKKAEAEKEKNAAAQRQAEQERLQLLALKEMRAKKAVQKPKEADSKNTKKIIAAILGILLLILGVIFIPPLFNNEGEDDALDITAEIKENQDSLKAEKNYQNLLKEAEDLFSKKDFANSKQKYGAAIAAIDTFNIDNKKAIAGKTAAERAHKKLVDQQSAQEKEDNYKNWKKKGDEEYENGDYSYARALYKDAQDFLDKREIQQKIKDCTDKIEEIKRRADNERNYSRYLKAGNNDYKSSNYKSAKSNYEKAKTYKNTSEIRNKITDCEKQLTPPKPTLSPIIQALERNMKNIPSGSFTMGCTSEQKSCHDDEKPTRIVNIRNFKMNKYEVTQEEWKAVMGENPSDFKNCDKCPVESVSWDDIQAFLKKLNKITGKNYRLPSEAEWEYAARGGEKYQYAGSNNLGNVARYNKNSNSKTHPVGSKNKNGYGLYDMSGNVWEWCQDKWHDTYKGAPKDGSAWTSGNSSYRVLRGGSWHNFAQFCRVSNRYDYYPDYRYNYDGFRLVHS